MTKPPKGWLVKPLLDIVTVTSGQVDPRLPHFRRMPLIAPDHIEPATGRLLDVRSAEQQGAISGKYRVDTGDIIYSKIRPYLQKAYLAEFPALCSADMYALKPRTGIDGNFIINTLLGEDFTAFAVGVSMRSGIPKINRTELAEYHLAVPSSSEQRRIGAALADTDVLIRVLERLIAKKRHVKQAMMQVLLTGRARLPGFTGEWRSVRLGEVAAVDPDMLSPVTMKGSDLIDYISLEDVSVGTVLGHTRMTFARSPSRARRRIKAGDILFGTVRPNLRSHALFRKRLPNPVASTGFSVIRCSTRESSPLFLGQWVLSEVVLRQVDRIIAGSNYPAVSSGDVRNLEVSLPRVEEQQAIGAALDDADSELAALERRLECARNVKRGMMQELLAGRTRLVAEGAAV